jgi:N-acetylglucosaminyldiphosphoundecaprenol N-acetyl-beta-D-mannosaminyltransferase
VTGQDVVERHPAKTPVLGIDISATSYAEVVECCRRWVAERRAGGADTARYICVASVHGVVTARQDPEIRGILNAADIATPDGMPLVWALRSFGVRGQQRVYGPELMLRLCEDAARSGHRIYLYGGREESLRELTRRLEARFPGIRIAGACSPPFRALTPEEDAETVARIRDSDVDLVFVGISTPKQERWMHAHRAGLPGAVLIGVGAAFDFHSGRVRQAPAWMRERGLEWLFRLAMEPFRLWRRYLLVTPRFLPLWALEWLARGARNLIGSRAKGAPSDGRSGTGRLKPASPGAGASGD